MTSRLPRPTVALLIATAISLALVGSTRIAGSPATQAARSSLRAALPTDPTDAAASFTSSDLRSSPEPRHIDSFTWLLTLAVTVVALMLGWLVRGGGRDDRRRGRVRIGPPGRAPPARVLAPLG